MCPPKNEYGVQSNFSLTENDNCLGLLVNSVKEVSFREELPTIMKFLSASLKLYPEKNTMKWSEVFSDTEEILNKAAAPDKEVNVQKALLSHFLRKSSEVNDAGASTMFAYLNVQLPYIHRLL